MPAIAPVPVVAKNRGHDPHGLDAVLGRGNQERPAALLLLEQRVQVLVRSRRQIVEDAQHLLRVRPAA